MLKTLDGGRREPQSRSAWCNFYSGKVFDVFLTTLGF